MSKLRFTLDLDCTENGTTITSTGIPLEDVTPEIPPQNGREDYRKEKRRKYSDEEVREWVGDWRDKHHSFYDIQEDTGVASQTIAYNVYRVTALDLLKENEELKKKLSECYKRSSKLAEKLAECESKKR